MCVNVLVWSGGRLRECVVRGKILENKKKEAEKRGWRDRRDRVF